VIPVIQVLLIVVLLLALFFILFAVYIAYRMAKPPREIGDWTPKTFGLDYVDFEIKTQDGITINGWYIDRKSSKTIFLLHGYTVSRWTFYIKKMVEFLRNEPYNIVLFDFRAHGKSGGKYTTVGDKEIEDFRAVLNKFATSQNCVVGYSMGGIIAIRALLEDKVSCAIADSPPIMMDLTGKRGLKYFANLPEWIYYIAKPFFTLITGGKTINIIELAEKIKKPLLIIEGEYDPLVRIREVLEFHKRNSVINKDVSLWINSGAHVRGIVADEGEYKERVIEFIHEKL